MFGWSIRARACRSASNRARTCRESMPGLDDLDGHRPLDRLGLLGHPDGAHAAFADLFEQLVGPDNRAGGLRGCRVGGGRGLFACRRPGTLPASRWACRRGPLGGATRGRRHRPDPGRLPSPPADGVPRRRERVPAFSRNQRSRRAAPLGLPYLPVRKARCGNPRKSDRIRNPRPGRRPNGSAARRGQRSRDGRRWCATGRVLRPLAPPSARQSSGG